MKEAFPTATIVRPGPMFGYEDKLLTNMAGALRHAVRQIEMRGLIMVYLYLQCGQFGGN